MSELKNKRQEKYARLLADGMTQRAAYKTVYPNPKGCADGTLDNKASELAKQPHVQERIRELQQAATSETILSITARKELLSAMALNERVKPQDRIKAIDVLNKMDGAYVEKVVLDGQVNNPFAGLSTEELKRIVNGR